MTRKKGHPARMEHAEKFVRLFHQHKDKHPESAARYLFWAHLSRRFGWLNALGDHLPKRGRPAGSDKRDYTAAVAWMRDHAAEHSGEYALAGACVDAGVIDVPTMTRRKSVVELLVRKYRAST